MKVLLLTYIAFALVATCLGSEEHNEGTQHGCIQGIGAVEPKYFYYRDTALSIKILTSSRLTHKIVSTIIKVFAEEVLGYTNVSLVEIENPRLSFEPDVQFANISSCEKNE